MNRSKIKQVLSNPLRIFLPLITRLPYFRFLRDTYDYQCRVTFSDWFMQKFFGRPGHRKVYWPVHPTSIVLDWQNIYAGVDSCPGLSIGNYIQGMGGINIGDYTRIAPNVGIISGNHDLYDIRKHTKKKVTIGKYCWIGMGAIILPGVELGDFTIVAAGAIVTKSFSQGYCIIGGNPAKLIKNLEKEKCIPYKHNIEYLGFIRKDKFEAFRKKKLNF